ncbi:MAG: hypothetical protein ABIQ95_00835 [Bdellovibrionia bacterium]
MNFRVGIFSALVLSFHLNIATFLTASLAEAAPVSLMERVDLELKNPMSSLRESTLEEIKGHHHVLVPGMMNEVANFLGLYYNEVKGFLDSIGAGYTYLGLPTKTSTLVNTEFLNLKLREIYESQEIKSPILLRGHSKGGVEVLLTVLKYPDLILDGIVDRVLLEQAAIRGSILALPSTFSFLNPFSYFYIEEGLKSVHTLDAQRNLDEAFETLEVALKDRFRKQAGDFPATFTPDKVYLNEEKEYVDLMMAIISSKIRYVRTYQDPNQLSLGTRIVLWACNQTLDKQSLNDGLVHLDHQKDERIGDDLGILKYDHVDLNISRLSNTTEAERLAIVRAVLGQLYDESNGEL